MWALSIVGLMLSCFMAPMVGLLIMIKAPFVAVVWMLDQIIAGAAFLCAWLEGIGA